MMEDLAGVAVDVEYASEYCYRSTHSDTDPIVVVITQSGETADTTAAQREALNRGAQTVAISNVADSTISREASVNLQTCAGLEKAIPATKSFTSQLTMLYLLALFLARQRGRMTAEVTRTHLPINSRLGEEGDTRPASEILETWLPWAARSGTEVIALADEFKEFTQRQNRRK